MLFLPCLYGIAFICLGNMAGNSLAFAGSVMQANQPDAVLVDAAGSGVDAVLDKATVCGVAIATATATCFIHTVSRRGGIVLNNIFAFVKTGILILIIITAIVVSAEGFPNAETGKAVENEIKGNVDTATSFKPINGVSGASNANGFAQAFLAISKSLFKSPPPARGFTMLTRASSIRVLRLQSDQLCTFQGLFTVRYGPCVLTLTC